jgi:hypothetical protein
MVQFCHARFAASLWHNQGNVTAGRKQAPAAFAVSAFARRRMAL